MALLFHALYLPISDFPSVSGPKDGLQSSLVVRLHYSWYCLTCKAEKRGRRQAHFLTGNEKLRYGLSDDSWTKATAELRTAGLIEVGRQSQGKDFDWSRMRNTYRVDLDQLEPSPSHWHTTRDGIRFIPS